MQAPTTDLPRPFLPRTLWLCRVALFWHSAMIMLLSLATALITFVFILLSDGTEAALYLGIGLLVIALLLVPAPFVLHGLANKSGKSLGIGTTLTLVEILAISCPISPGYVQGLTGSATRDILATLVLVPILIGYTLVLIDLIVVSQQVRLAKREP